MRASSSLSSRTTARLMNRLKEQVRKLRVGLQDLQDKRQHADIQLALFENDGEADRAEAPLNTGQSTYRSYSWITLTHP
eukprot:scaffold1700_cov259-Pinguiococcus_pyrenoidosus.AAC.1